MTAKRAIVRVLNTMLGPLNIVIDSRSTERAEAARLAALEAAGHFTRPVFPLLPQFGRCDPAPLLATVERYRDATARFLAPATAEEYGFDNAYFGSADAEVAYAIVRDNKPKTIVEIGSGNSTLLLRAAITDENLRARLVSIDPSPRRSISHAADEIIAEPAEQVPADYFSANLQSGDVLFIDSSHRVKIGGDVVKIILEIMPALPPGVLIHLHDIFLPYDYPRGWVIGERWVMEEQYLVQAMLQGSHDYEVLWPGYHVQHVLPGFAAHFHQAQASDATSLWLRKRR